MFFRKPGDQRVSSVPAGWTDVEGPDPVVAMSAGRSHFRLADLVELRVLLSEIEKEQCKRDFAGNVRQILPVGLPGPERPK